MKSKFIFRNHVNNYITSSIQIDGETKVSIIKSTFDKHSFSQLHNEYNGYLWYSKFNPFNLKLTKNKNLNYMQLNIEYFEGIKLNYRHGLTINYSKILSIIEYYHNISKKNFLISKNYPFHGDLSIDNIIFTKNNIIIIDWQYFKLLDNNLGFDILNLIFEQLYFDLNYMWLFRSYQNILKRLINILKYVFNNSMIETHYKVNPLKKIRAYIRENNKIIWNNQSYKLPVTKYSDMQVRFIDNYIKLNIN